MARDALFTWEGREYDYNPKSTDWYWALGIIAVALVLAFILFGNYLLALLVTIAAAALAVHAANEPPVHRFRLIEQGIVIGDELHPFESMVSFSVLEDVEGELPPILSIKTESWLSPHLLIPLTGVDADMIYGYFLQHVDEEEHRHNLVTLVATWLRL